MVCEGWNDAGTSAANGDGERRGAAGKREGVGSGGAGLFCRPGGRRRRSAGGHQRHFEQREVGDEGRRRRRGQPSVSAEQAVSVGRGSEAARFDALGSSKARASTKGETMGITLAPEVRTLIDRPNFAHLATIMPDGSPHSAPVWVAREGDLILIATEESSLKGKNTRRDPRISLSIVD